MGWAPNDKDGVRETMPNINFTLSTSMGRNTSNTIPPIAKSATSSRGRRGVVANVLAVLVIEVFATIAVATLVSHAMASRWIVWID
jgi:hypothetical protein